MKFDILTIFPEIFSAKGGPASSGESFAYFANSVLARAVKKGLIKIKAHDLRKWATDKHRTVDDKPYGGGVGMVMKVDVMAKALKSLVKQKSKGKKTSERTRIILMCPQGKPFTQREAKRLNRYYDRLILISGRYEGYDERIRKLVDEEISIGDYVLTGGELPAMVVTDAVARLVPGVVGKPQSLQSESFNNNLLDFPQYTRPANFEGKKVPEVLLKGDHEKIEKWRAEQALKKTKKIRPDLLK